jgi:hypothetical protein
MKKHYLFAITFFISVPALAQADFEIQVYGSDIAQKGESSIELHSNYTLNGVRENPNPGSVRFLNESIEMVHGFGHHFEFGLYLFSSLAPDGSYQFRGTHIRPEFSAPERWHLPFGAAFSVELGYVKRNLDSTFDFDSEIRPIIDKEFGRWYVAFNPNISYIAADNDNPWDFAPQLKAWGKLNKSIAFGFEYYTMLGNFRDFSPLKEQEHLLGPMIDLLGNEDYELNGGVLFGLTPNSNQTIIKLILGRSYSGRKRSNN